MNYDQLVELNKEFAQESVELQDEFTELFEKWLRKSPRLALVSFLSLPIGIILTLMEKKDGAIEELFPDLPNVWRRYLSPWIALRDKWGKIPSQQFIEEYGKLHSEQYDEWFPSKEEKAAFTEWYKGQNSS